MWISVADKKPPCPRKSDLGTPVIVAVKGACESSIAFYGKCVSGKPDFYLYGAVLSGITHWQLFPKPPKDQID